ncbi:MAG TPA: hypothetical protein VGQ81_02295 [Acidobacteriota bacterium]|nr:hypothetical protein [Acidobacteriota bacterium]
MRRCCACLLVTFFTLGLLYNLNAWRWTCQLSRRFVSELRQLEPSPPPDTEFAFFGLPESVRGIFFLPVGLRDLAVKEAYGREDLHASRSADAFSGATQPAAPGRRLIKLYWKGTTDHLLASGKN